MIVVFISIPIKAKKNANCKPNLWITQQERIFCGIMKNSLAGSQICFFPENGYILIVLNQMQGKGGKQP